MIDAARMWIAETVIDLALLWQFSRAMRDGRG